MIEVLVTVWTATDKTYRLFGIDTETKDWCFLSVRTEREVLTMPLAEVLDLVQRFDKTYLAVSFFEKMLIETESTSIKSFAELALEILYEIEES